MEGKCYYLYLFGNCFSAQWTLKKLELNLTKFLHFDSANFTAKVMTREVLENFLAILEYFHAYWTRVFNASFGGFGITGFCVDINGNMTFHDFSRCFQVAT